MSHNQAKTSINPTAFISNSSNEFKVNSIASLLEICERMYEGLLDSENLTKFTSYPVLYGKVVAFTTSLLIVASKLEQANPDFHSECRSLGLKLQLIFMELCSISTKVAFQKDHASHFLFGARFLVEAESFFHNSFYNEVYGQAIGNLLDVLDRQVEVTSSFGDDVIETETLVKIPASSDLHSYNFSLSNREVQLYQTYVAAKLLYKKVKSELNLLEALYQLFRDSPEKKQIAVMSVVLIDYLQKLEYFFSCTLSKVLYEKLERLSYLAMNGIALKPLFCFVSSYLVTSSLSGLTMSKFPLTALTFLTGFASFI